MKDYSIIIPAYKPPEILVSLVQKLIELDIPAVIVINDGSPADYNHIFERVKTIDGTHIINHDRNKGKGAGLKNGMAYHHEHFPNLTGVVTADADGQHLIEDIIRIGDLLVEKNTDYVLGMRDLRFKEVPLRSKLGNAVSAVVFKALFGQKFYDTQTGLRAIATSEIPNLLELDGERYEYELEMLIHMAQDHKHVVRADIKTVYQEDRVTHFETFADSLKIAKTMLKRR